MSDEMWLVEMHRTHDGKLERVGREVYDGRPGDPCCVLTASGKHRADCPRIHALNLDALLDAVHPILAAYRSEEAHITEEQITDAWAAYDAARRSAA